MSQVSSKCIIATPSILPRVRLPRANLPEFPQMLVNPFQFLVITPHLLSQNVGHGPQDLTLQSFLWVSGAPYTQKEAMYHEGEGDTSWTLFSK